MKRTKQYRRHQDKTKDLHRRFMYKNRAINGRYELNPDKDDDSVSIVNSMPGYGRTHFSEVTVQPEKLDKNLGHWQEYPKTKYYGSKGYYKMKGRKCKAFKEIVLSKLIEKEEL